MHPQQCPATIGSYLGLLNNIQAHSYWSNLRHMIRKITGDVFCILDGKGNLLFLFDPNDAQEVYRNEGKYPYRGQIFSAFKMLKASRPGWLNLLWHILLLKVRIVPACLNISKYVLCNDAPTELMFKLDQTVSRVLLHIFQTSLLKIMASSLKRVRSGMRSGHGCSRTWWDPSLQPSTLTRSRTSRTSLSNTSGGIEILQVCRFDW